MLTAWMTTSESEGEMAKKKAADAVDVVVQAEPQVDDWTEAFRVTREDVIDLLKHGAPAGDVRLMAVASLVPGLDATQRLKSGHPGVREVLNRF